MKWRANKSQLVIYSAVMSVMAVIVLWAALWRTPAIVATFDGNVASTCRLPTTFTLSWRHSVEKQYWQEIYTLSDDGLILSKSYVQTFGAGVPVDGVPTPAPTGYVGQRINRPVAQLHMMVSPTMNAKLFAADLLHTHSAITPATANATLSADAQVLPITPPVDDYRELSIGVMALSAWQRMMMATCFG